MAEDWQKRNPNLPGELRDMRSRVLPYTIPNEERSDERRKTGVTRPMWRPLRNPANSKKNPRSHRPGVARTGEPPGRLPPALPRRAVRGTKNGVGGWRQAVSFWNGYSETAMVEKPFGGRTNLATKFMRLKSDVVIVETTRREINIAI